MVLILFLFFQLLHCGQQSPQFCEFSFLFLIIIQYGCLAEIRWSVSMTESHMSLCAPFSRTEDGLGIYHLFVWSNLNVLHNSQCLVAYSFHANLPHSLIMWLLVSSQLLDNLHFLFYCVLSILALIWLVLMVIFLCFYLRESQFLS